MSGRCFPGAKRWRQAARLAVLCTIAGATFGAGDTGTVTGIPKLAVPTGKCVEDTAFMRRNHMELLSHQRDKTVHDGIRTTRHSLANCVNCHASKETGRATGSRNAFCEGCHTYAGVKLDCFECHSDKAQPAVAAVVAPAGAKR